MHYSYNAIIQFIDQFEEKHNPVVNRTFQVAKQEKTLTFKVENVASGETHGTRRKFFMSYDGVNHIRIDKTEHRLIYSTENPQRNALTLRRNQLQSKLTPELIQKNPKAKKMYKLMMSFHKRLTGAEFQPPRYVIKELEREQFQKLYLSSPNNYEEFTPELKEKLTNKFLPGLKSFFPKSKLSWWATSRKKIAGREFSIFETFDNENFSRKLYKRFILSHVEQTKKMDMIYGLDSKNKVTFLFGFYRAGYGDGKFGSINDKVLFPASVIKRFNSMGTAPDAKERAKAEMLNTAY